MRVVVGLLILAVSVSLRAQEESQFAEVIVPVVGSVLGTQQVHWKTNLELRNDGRTEATVALILSATEERSIILSLAPGESVRFDDVVGEAFGAQETISPLIVRTMGRRSVGIRATVYGTRGTEIFPPQPIDLHHGAGYFGHRALQNLSFSDAFRTNIGLANLGPEPAEFVLALQRLPGRNLALSHVSVPPRTLLHFPIQQAFPLIAKGDHFTVVVETSDRQTYAYASVIENATHTARFVQAAVAAKTSMARR